MRINLFFIFGMLLVNTAFSWQMNGVSVCTADGLQLFPEVMADDNGGAIIVWEDARPISGQAHGYEVYTQKVDSSGILQWPSAGVRASTLPEGFPEHGHRLSARIATDGAGGVIIAWVNHHRIPKTGAPNEKFHPGIYAQRINDGNLVWNSGKPVEIVSYTQGGLEPDFTPTICSDGAGGVICAWIDPPDKYDPNYYVKATRLDEDYGVWIKD
jgi:hypothetical protein